VKEMITITKDKVSEIIDIINNLMGMMEPYYAQCSDSTVSAYRLIDELELHLPYVEELYPTNKCALCDKSIFSASAYRQHQRDVHQRTKLTKQEIDYVVMTVDKIWPTKQLYLESINE
jgi:hypothetical protein